MTIFAGHRWLVLAAVLPSAFITFRVFGGLLSVADVVLAVAALAAVRGMSSDDLRRAWGVLRWVVLYGGVLLVPLVANPTGAAIQDWGRRGFIMVAGLLVGMALVREHADRISLYFFAIAAATTSLAAVLDFVATGEPAYPFGLSKNHVGGLLAVAVLVECRAAWRAPIWRQALRVLLLVGLLSTQSRSAWVVVCVGLLVWGTNAPFARRRTAVIILIALAGGALATYSVVRTEAAAVGPVEGSSVAGRLAFQRRAMELWSESPYIGNGLRFYEDPAYGFPRALSAEAPGGGVRHPHNVVAETLSESGLVGGVALFALLSGVLGTIWGLGVEGRFASALWVGMLSLGMIDLYWLAGRTSTVWVFIGVAMAAQAASERTWEQDGGLAARR